MAAGSIEPSHQVPFPDASQAIVACDASALALPGSVTVVLMDTSSAGGIKIHFFHRECGGSLQANQTQNTNLN